jgi:hypothetical protein
LGEAVSHVIKYGDTPAVPVAIFCDPQHRPIAVIAAHLGTEKGQPSGFNVTLLTDYLIYARENHINIQTDAG